MSFSKCTGNYKLFHKNIYEGNEYEKNNTNLLPLCIYHNNDMQFPLTTLPRPYNHRFL